MSRRLSHFALELSTSDIDVFFTLNQIFMAWKASAPAAASARGGTADVLAAALEHHRMAVTRLPVDRAASAKTLSEVQAAFDAAVGEEAAGRIFSELRSQAINTPSAASLTVSASSNNIRNNGAAKPSHLQKSCYVQTRMQKVVQGLFIGSFHPANDKSLMQAQGITHICCCIDIRPRFPSDFAYMTIPASDAAEYDIAAHFEKTFCFMEDALNGGGRVLVHCGAGISRAPTIAAAYLMRKLQISAVSAVQLLRSVRSCVSPNMGFMEQLLEYQKAVVGQQFDARERTFLPLALAVAVPAN